MGKDNNMVEVEIEKNNFIVMENDKAIEFCTQEFFKNGKELKINGKKFDILSFGNFNYKTKLQLV